MKINLGVDRLPAAAANARRPCSPTTRGIMEVEPTVAEMDAPRHEARAGRSAADPHIEVCIPTVHDPRWRPTASTCVTIDVNSQPYTLTPTGTWDEIRDAVADRAIASSRATCPA